jgi:hypothetical protein
MATCTRDSDCVVKRTLCCKPDRIDIRPIRGDKAGELPKLVCPRGSTVCEAAEDPELINSFTVGCVENRCRTLTPMTPEWCEPDRDMHYRIAQRDRTVATRDLTLECYGMSGAPACRTDASCYQETAPEAPRPPAAARACKRDADCGLTFVGCCACGATEFRAVNAKSKWTSCTQKQPVACPACVGPAPAELAAVCIKGSCEAVRAADAQVCASK